MPTLTIPLIFYSNDLTLIFRSAKDSVKEDRRVAIKKISLQTQKPRLSDVKNVLREVVILRYAKNPQVIIIAQFFDFTLAVVYRAC